MRVGCGHVGHQLAQVSMMRVRYGVMPAVRTGQTLTCQAAEDDSNI